MLLIPHLSRMVVVALSLAMVRQPRLTSGAGQRLLPDMSEHEFRFFQSEWNLYKRATKVDKLWSCMSECLKKLNTEQLMMAMIKSIAVTVLHTAVHILHLHEARQIPVEKPKAFATRARRIASNCILYKKCSCGDDVSNLD